MTDLQRFLELYSSFGIECQVTRTKQETGELQVVTLIADPEDAEEIPGLTYHRSLLGVPKSAGVRIFFDLDGDYVSHLFGEFGSAVVDRNVESVVQQLRERCVNGFLKYGQTTERTDLPLNEWLKHLQEELMDGSIYIAKLRALSKQMEKLEQFLSE